MVLNSTCAPAVSVLRQGSPRMRGTGRRCQMPLSCHSSDCVCTILQADWSSAAHKGGLRSGLPASVLSLAHPACSLNG